MWRLKAWGRSTWLYRFYKEHTLRRHGVRFICFEPSREEIMVSWRDYLRAMRIARRVEASLTDLEKGIWPTK